MFYSSIVCHRCVLYIEVSTYPEPPAESSIDDYDGSPTNKNDTHLPFRKLRLGWFRLVARSAPRRHWSSTDSVACLLGTGSSVLFLRKIAVDAIYRIERNIFEGQFVRSFVLLVWNRHCKNVMGLLYHGLFRNCTLSSIPTFLSGNCPRDRV